jgi:hypothetical protein
MAQMTTILTPAVIGYCNLGFICNLVLVIWYLNGLVIGYCNLGFICNLVLAIWNLNGLVLVICYF